MAAAGVKKLAAVSTSASLNVHAINEEETPKKLVKPSQLPIYNVPCVRVRYIEEQPGPLQRGIAPIRRTACHYIGWCKGVYVWMKNGILNTVQFGKDAYVYLKNPPQDFLPTIAVITASGLVGLVSAKKGSKFKKIAYPLGLTTLGASVCYPTQAIVITKVTGEKAYATSQWIYEYLASWSENHTHKKTELKAEMKPEREVKLDKPTNVAATESKVSTFTAEMAKNIKPSSADAVTTTKFKADPKLMDYGQSNPEDVDMYSTRS